MSTAQVSSTNKTVLTDLKGGTTTCSQVTGLKIGYRGAYVMCQDESA